jgi:hypothetical protein
MSSGILFRPLRIGLQGLADRCQQEPVHLHRDTNVALTESGQEAEVTLNVHCYPMLESLKEVVQIPWVAHVMEESGWENVVLPKPLYDVFAREFQQAGFSVAPDRRQFASADGLEEALKAGSNFNKKWE